RRHCSARKTAHRQRMARAFAQRCRFADAKGVVCENREQVPPIRRKEQSRAGPVGEFADTGLQWEAIRFGGTTSDIPEPNTSSPATDDQLAAVRGKLTLAHGSYVASQPAGNRARERFLQ